MSLKAIESEIEKFEREMGRSDIKKTEAEAPGAGWEAPICRELRVVKNWSQFEQFMSNALSNERALFYSASYSHVTF